MIYAGQAYTLSLDTGTPLTTATTKKIVYQKPDGTKGEKEATESNAPGKTIPTILSIDFTEAENNLVGDWQFQAHVVVDGKTYFGTIYSQTVFNNLK